MALRATEFWEEWLSDLPFSPETIKAYAKELHKGEVTKDDLSELNHELLNEVNINILGHRIKILKKAKEETTPVTMSESISRATKSDVKLPSIHKSCSPSQFRKFLVDWNIYKSENLLTVQKYNKLIYCACDESLQNSIINGMPNFLEISEDALLNYIKETATEASNPTVYRLAFQRLDQLPHQTVEQYVDILRDKAVDCEFTCPSQSCQFDYSSFAIRDRLIQGLHDKKSQTNILTNIKALPTLQDVVKHAKSLETAQKDVCSMEVTNQEPEVFNINAARSSTYKKSLRNQSRPNMPKSNEEPCTGCGKIGHSTFEERKAKCPAWSKICNNCGIRNHFASVCKRPKGMALALVARAYEDKDTVIDKDMLCVGVTPMFDNCIGKKYKVNALPDTGANICLAGRDLMNSMDIPESSLHSCSKVVHTAGGHHIKTFGSINMELQLDSKEKSVQTVYFAEKIKRFYLSKQACIQLKILPADFPNTIASISEDRQESSLEKIPTRPSEIPFPPTEENVVKLENFLKESFSSSTFSQQAPFPSMSNSIPAKIHLKEGAVPHFKGVPIPVPLHWRETIKKQLDDDVERGVIEPVPVGEAVSWCSQMVIIPKPDGRPRRTVDFQSLNNQCYRKLHHCQPPFTLATQIPTNVKKTLFDAVDGYHAIPLDKESRHLTTFITPWGSYRYCRLPQGFVASGDVYTRRYDELIKDLPRKVKCVDDLLIWDDNISDAFFRAWDFLTFCACNGIMLSPKKFQFCRDTIDFAGLRISNNGISPSEKMLDAIQNFPAPTNLTDARAWFGLVNQVSWAHADSSSMLPFRELIKANNKFYWDSTLQQIFDESKTKIIALVQQGVRLFETDRQTCLLTDWSRDGMGFLLMQKHCNCSSKDDPHCCKDGWKLVYAGSRFTKEAESRYSPTEGEATAVAWGLSKSKFFTLGCKNLIIASDHQPLVGYFKKQLSQITSPRLLRIREKTLMYDFKVVYVPAKKNKGADAISRSPVNDELNVLFHIDEEINEITHSVIASLNDTGVSQDNADCINYASLKAAIDSDNTYKCLRDYIRSGFPESKHMLSTEAQDFWNVRERLSETSDGVILLDQRVVVPKSCRKSVLKLLHAAHQGVSSMKRRANQNVYWPRINNDLKNIRENCAFCDSVAPQHTKEKLILTPDPEFPFQEVAGDFFFVKGHTYLVLVDRYSSWFTISHFSPGQATSKRLINECIALFSAYGAPETFTSDGGTQFTSEEFQSFLCDWDIKHRVSAPHYPQSNGRAEAAVKSAKRIISDHVSESEPYNHKKIALAILQHRNTPMSDLQLSPAQLLFHRQIRDRVPTHPKHLRLHKEWILTSRQREELYKTKNEAAMRRYNHISTNLSPLHVRDRVLVLTQEKNPRWTISGVVVMKLPFRRYKIKLDGSGRIVVRNRRFLRKYSCRRALPDSCDWSCVQLLPVTSPVQLSPIIPQHSESPGRQQLPESHTTTTDDFSRVHPELRPHNRRGLLEQENFEYRTTRSKRQY